MKAPFDFATGDRVHLFLNDADRAKLGTALADAEGIAYGHVDDDLTSGARSTKLLISFLAEDDVRYTGPHPHRSYARGGATYWIGPEERDADRIAQESTA